MRKLTDYEQSRIKNAIHLSKNFSEPAERKEIKQLIKKDLDKESFNKIRNFLEFMLHSQVTRAMYNDSNYIENLDYAQCIIIAMKHLLRAKLDMKELME